MLEQTRRKIVSRRVWKINKMPYISSKNGISSSLLLVERLQNLGPDDWAELLSGQFEGDMVLSPEEIELLTGGGRGGRTGLSDKKYRWKDNIIPYTIREADFSECASFLLPIYFALEILQQVLRSITFILVPRDSTRRRA